MPQPGEAPVAARFDLMEKIISCSTHHKEELIG
jgi:hypothetical protein